MLVECTRLLLNVALQVDIDDVWTWIPNSAVEYTVGGAYRTLTCGTSPNTINALVSADLLWRKDVPIKVSVFTWRLFWNRLPTKLSLYRRGIISNEAQYCICGGGVHEFDTHLFLNCDFLVRYGTLFAIDWVFNPRFHLP